MPGIKTQVPRPPELPAELTESTQAFLTRLMHGNTFGRMRTEELFRLGQQDQQDEDPPVEKEDEE